MTRRALLLSETWRKNRSLPPGTPVEVVRALWGGESWIEARGPTAVPVSEGDLTIILKRVEL